MQKKKAKAKRWKGTVNMRMREDAQQKLVAMRDKYRFASISDVIDILEEGWGRLPEHTQHEVMGRPLPAAR
jgi:hypothetical protein